MTERVRGEFQRRQLTDPLEGTDAGAMTAYEFACVKRVMNSTVRFRVRSETREWSGKLTTSRQAFSATGHMPIW